MRVSLPSCDSFHENIRFSKIKYKYAINIFNEEYILRILHY